MKSNRQSVLIVTSVASMVDQFLMSDIQLLIEMGYHVDVATNFVRGNTCSEETVEVLRKSLSDMGVDCFQVDFERSVFHILKNGRAYRQLAEILQNHNRQYTFIHCHSPIGGILGRIAAKRNGIRCIYTAHGFHFYKGAPLWNWLLYYPVEKSLSRITDVLITVNREDYRRAKRKFHAGRTYFVPGVGIDVERLAKTEVDREAKKAELGMNENDRLLLSVGELNKNKNHRVVIDALGKVKKEDSKFAHHLHYCIAGQGKLGGKLIKQADRLGINLHLLGYRDDISELLRTADLYVHPSKREGMPVALMEAVAAKCPAVCSDIRGNRELVTDRKCRFDPMDSTALAEKLFAWQEGSLASDVQVNFENVKKHDVRQVKKRMKAIYRQMG